MVWAADNVTATLKIPTAILPTLLYPISSPYSTCADTSQSRNDEEVNVDNERLRHRHDGQNRDRGKERRHHPREQHYVGMAHEHGNEANPVRGTDEARRQRGLEGDSIAQCRHGGEEITGSCTRVVGAPQCCDGS